MVGTSVRVGIIGCGSVMQGGYMGQVERLRGRGLIEVVIAADRNESRRSMVNDLGIHRFSTSADDVIDADDVDAVVILTSNPSHAALAEAALRRGKHVLVEKPMATSLEEAARLVDLANRGPGLLICAPHVVMSPTFQSVWWKIQRGEIGRIHLARARYGWAGPTWNRWFYEREGGALFDVAMYNITSLTGLLGPVRRVVAMTGVANTDRRVDGERVEVVAEDNAQVLLDFGDATFGVVTAGFTMQQYRGPGLEVYGSDGTIQILGDDWAPLGHEMWRRDVGAWQAFKELDPAWPWTDGLRHLVECIRSGAQPVIRPEHAYHALEVVLKARIASETGRSQTVESRFDPLALEEPRHDEPVHLIHDPRR